MSSSRTVPPPVTTGISVTEPGPNPDALLANNPVPFKVWPETGVVIDVMNVLEKLAGLATVELTKKK